MKALGMYSHERRRIKGNLIETYTILTGREGIDSAQFFQRARTELGLRGHNLKLCAEEKKAFGSIFSAVGW
jgi:hypothetical protein